MNSCKRALTLAVALMLIVSSGILAGAPKLLTYQGRLTDAAGKALNGTYDLNCRIYDAPTNGNIIWHETHNGVTVTDGLFSVALGALHSPSPELSDALFADTLRWLGITVGTDPELVPRVRLMTVPYAFRVATVDGAKGGTIGDSLTVAGTIHFTSGGLKFPDGTTQFTQAGASNGLPQAGGTMTGPISSVGDPPIAMGKSNFGSNNANPGLNAIVAGESDTASGDHCTVSGGYGNAATGENPDSASDAGIHSKLLLQAGNGATVCGGGGNKATGSFSAIGGGVENGASGGYSSIGGGEHNVASNKYSTVGGGLLNFAEGFGSTIGGGSVNCAFGTRSVVAGGGSDSAVGTGSVVSGGLFNVASGGRSVIPGGRYNKAAGDQSFAAGDYAKALHEGAFVWASGSQGVAQPFSSTAPYQFLIHASGGVGIGTNAPQEQLDVAGSIRASGFKMPTGGSVGYILTSDANGVGTWQPGSGSGSGWHDDGTVVRLDWRGDWVGIGTTSPQQKLDVDGGIQTKGFKMPTGAVAGYVLTSDASGAGTWQAPGGAVGGGWTDDGANVRLTTANDNVGIGIASPEAKLDVAGDVKINLTSASTYSTTGMSVLAENTSTGGTIGGFFQATGPATESFLNYGILGSASGSSSRNVGVHGTAYGNPGTITGVRGETYKSPAETGVAEGGYFEARNEGTGTAIAVTGIAIGNIGSAEVTGGKLVAFASNSQNAVGASVSAVGEGPWVHGLQASASSNNSDPVAIDAYSIIPNGGTGVARGIIGIVDNNGSGSSYGCDIQVVRHYSTFPAYGGNFSVTSYDASATTFGIRATAFGGGTNWAGWFDGNVNVTGTLTKGGGAFKIDHPLDPENKYLQHSFVESPDMKNIYDGTVITGGDGKAVVTLPDYFTALNRDFRYQLTVIGQFSQAIIAEEISNNQFTIGTDKPNVKVSWQITGIRKDVWAEKNRIQVEIDKKPEERGKYLHTEAYGKPVEQSVNYEQIKKVRVHSNQVRNGN